MAELFVGKEVDFGDLDRKIVVQGDLQIGVFRVNGSFHAYENECVHRGGPVCQGKIMNRVEEVLGDDQTSRGLRFSEDRVHIICPWHGYEYDVKSGRNAGDPKLRLRKFDTEVRSGGVYVLI